ncbi:oxidoreductase [Streptomyces sp. NP160]|uniref:oxidoreductase n=1 Tax=Streptomyces sp. NP160 TaxID=2586637 RepID=UPI0027D76FEA|nr:oxidoreductase [Streptomyces sp. NP160]
MATPWTTAQIPDQTGRTVLVTGATSGLGRESAKELAARGARVVLAVRDTAKGQRVAAGLAGTTEVRRLDLSDLASVRAFADSWAQQDDDARRIDVVVANAGIMMVPFARTADGFESQVGTNHLGHHALVCRLLPHLHEDGRVVVLSSLVHKAGKVDLGDLNWEHRSYSASGAYAQSKLANLLFALELQRRLHASGSRQRVLAAHPGWAATNLQGRSGNALADRLTGIGNRVVAQSAAAGAQPTLAAATADLPGGSFLGPSGPGEVRGAPRLVGRTALASDLGLAADLWALSAQLTGVDALERAAAR